MSNKSSVNALRCTLYALVGVARHLHVHEGDGQNHVNNILHNNLALFKKRG